MAIPLEDQFNDIIGKAMRGLALAESVVADRAEVTAQQVQQLRDGTWNAEAARKVAPVLGLGAEALALAGEQSWAPEPVSLEGLAQFNTVFEDMTVNAYLVWDPASKEAAAFDTGSDAGDMMADATSRGLTIRTIFITHTHGDHIFDFDRLREKTGARAYVGEHEPLEGAEPFAASSSFEIGSLKVETRLTWGHSTGGITYFITGLARPVAIVGDAIFAGSMGGGGVSYADALRTNREQILTLPKETIICPGHGPMTTVAEELVRNPFFAR
jgi:glyoxylase-like metal-dependent hydrolase (beta-lactamase superfamily II)